MICRQVAGGFQQKADGYLANGREWPSDPMRTGVATDALPGRLIRAA